MRNAVSELADRLGIRASLARRRGQLSGLRGRERPTQIVHCTHHKGGTVWLNRILIDIARVRGWTIDSSFDGGRVPPTDIALYSVVGTLSPEQVVRAYTGDDADRSVASQEFLQRTGLQPGRFRGSHMIRDPRDMIVSGWHYHLRCTEPWALEPKDRWGGRSYQAMLKGMNRRDGLLAEIEWAAPRTLVHMARWDYRQPEFFELRYEELLVDETRWFTRVFGHYGFDASQVEEGLAIAGRYSRRDLSADDPHVRSGEPGEWREFFEPDHVALFKVRTGDLLVKLDYESDLEW